MSCRTRRMTRLPRASRTMYRSSLVPMRTKPALIPDLATVRAATFDADITKRWGVLPPALSAPYPHTTDAEAVRARLDFERDLRFGWDMWAWASLEATHGKNAVYYYHFAHDPPFPSDSVYAGWGPSHYAELWYSFDHLNQERWA